MPVLTEQPHDASFVLSEDDFGNRSTDNIVIASGAGVLQAGTVLGKITASGKYVARDHTLNNGAQTAAAILRARTDATSADQKAVGYTRACEVYRSLLIWSSNDLAADITTGLTQLAAQGVIAR